MNNPENRISEQAGTEVDIDRLGKLKLSKLASLRKELGNVRERRVAAAILRRLTDEWREAGLGGRSRMRRSSINTLCAEEREYFREKLQQCLQLDIRGVVDDPQGVREVLGRGLNVKRLRLREDESETDWIARTLVDLQEHLILDEPVDLASGRFLGNRLLVGLGSVAAIGGMFIIWLFSMSGSLDLGQWFLVAAALLIWYAANQWNRNDRRNLLRHLAMYVAVLADYGLLRDEDDAEAEAASEQDVDEMPDAEHRERDGVSRQAGKKDRQ